MRIRRADKHDIPQIARLLHGYDLYEHGLDRRMEVKSESAYRSELSVQFRNREYIFIVAIDGNRMVAFISYCIWRTGRSKRAAIGDMFVAEGSRRKGIGRTLVGRALSEMKRRGCSSVESGVRPRNIGSQRFWRRQGFTVAHSYQPSYRIGRKL